MNHNVNDKSSFRESVSFYLGQSRGMLFVAGIASVVVIAISMANHFPAW